MSAQLNIERIKSLTTSQYDICREAALMRVQKRVGKRPERKDFERQLASIWTALDVIALVVFAAALTVSSVHIIVHMGQLADTSYRTLVQSNTGTYIGNDLYTAIHQWGMIFMSEGSMILFSVLFGLTRKTWRRWIFAALAIVAAGFVIVANWQSEVGGLESIMPAVFTLGLGVNLERLLVSTLKRREDVTEKYLAALVMWEAASVNPTKHPDYLPVLQQEIWQKLVSLTANKAFVDASPDVRITAVRRELERDSWAYADTSNVNLLPHIGNGSTSDFLSAQARQSMNPALATNDNGNQSG